MNGISLERNILELESRIAAAAKRAGRSPEEITVVAVTKTVEVKAIEKAFQAGIRHFGENRVQEAKGKIEQLSFLEPCPTWHMVGHLQSNKANIAVEIFDVIHSIDSIKLAESISHLAQRELPVLLQVNVSEEASKSGFSVSEVLAAAEKIASLPHLEIKGLMTIAPLVSDTEEARPFFRQLRLLRDSLGIEHLSMGMSDDFEVAVEEGATMLRIGRTIFGERRG